MFGGNIHVVEVFEETELRRARSDAAGIVQHGMIRHCGFVVDDCGCVLGKVLQRVAI